MCHYHVRLYYIEKRTTHSHTRVGGAGGYGGMGVGYNKGAVDGIMGSPANPPDRHLYSGGRGGKGGAWGVKGATGGRGYGNGASGGGGYAFAPAITGKSHLVTGSGAKQGNLSGGAV